MASPAPKWRPNIGKCPRDLKGTAKRIVVELANGRVSGEEPVSTVTPAGWPADGRHGPRWSLAGSPFDIKRFYVLGDIA